MTPCTESLNYPEKKTIIGFNKNGYADDIPPHETEKKFTVQIKGVFT